VTGQQPNSAIQPTNTKGKASKNHPKPANQSKPKPKPNLASQPKPLLSRISQVIKFGCHPAKLLFASHFYLDQQTGQ
jgi:hypothetical protein